MSADTTVNAKMMALLRGIGKHERVPANIDGGIKVDKLVLTARDKGFLRMTRITYLSRPLIGRRRRCGVTWLALTDKGRAWLERR